VVRVNVNAANCLYLTDRRFIDGMVISNPEIYYLLVKSGNLQTTALPSSAQLLEVKYQWPN